jgi:hypothetical protein
MFTSKELYMMNGGNLLYMYKDGFGDVYNATPAEEAEWSKEVVAKALATIDTQENAIELQFAIENLRFHHYPDLKTFLIEKIKDTSPARQEAFATALWDIFTYKTYSR